MDSLIIFLPAALIVVAVVLVISVIASGYLKAPPNEAFIISGFRKENRWLIGRAGIKIPFLERVDKIDLSLIPIDVKTSTEVPTADFINIRVDATVNTKIGKTQEMLDRAAVNFLNLPSEGIGRIAREVLEGNVREIVGRMKLKEMVTDRETFATLVKESAEPDLAAMGLEIISFNVQNFFDPNGVIDNLGTDNVEEIRKVASIAKANSKRDVAIEEAKAAQEANAAQVAAQEQIAEKNALLEKRRAELKQDVDTKQAQANAAMQIEGENQRKLKDVAATNADIARTEREAELKKQEIELKERELDALVRKQADADKYAAEQKAEAELIAAKKKAEAERYALEQIANAKKIDAEVARYAAEQEALAQQKRADADKYAALAQAEGIAAIGIAEAEAIQKKAEAQKMMGEASIVDLVMNTLPKITESAAAPLGNVDKIVMYGDGNASKMVGDVMKTSNQIFEGIKEATGLDITSLVSQFTSGKKTD